MKKLALLIALALVAPAVISQTTDPVVTPAGGATTIGGISAANFAIGAIIVIGGVAFAVSQSDNGNVFVPVTTGTR